MSEFVFDVDEKPPVYVGRGSVACGPEARLEEKYSR